METTAKRIRLINAISWPVIILLFTGLFIQIIWPYTSGRLDIDFLLTKQQIIHVDYYRVAFYTHIFSSPMVLASGAVLFSGFVLKKHPQLHRIAGRLYVLVLLLASAPSGLVMGFHANGGLAAQTSFFLLTPLWWWFTWKGFQTARQRQFAAHRSWMVRSYALTLSAVSLRVYQFLLGNFVEMDFEQQYVLVSWAAWLGNLLLAEWLIYRRQKQSKPLKSKTFDEKLSLMLAQE